jgi:transposase
VQELPDLSKLSVAQKDALIVGLFEQVRALAARVEMLSARVTELEGQARKDSHNSSKPPSSDGLRKPKSLRAPAGRKPGGQAGHGGSTLERVANPEAIIEHPLAGRCERCGAVLDTREHTTIRRQVFDWVKPVLRVTEHVGYEMHCTCGQAQCSVFPAGVRAPVQYGPLIKSTVVYLTQQQLLPIGRTVQIIEDLFEVKLSAGSVQASIREAARGLTPAWQRIAAAVTQAPVAHFDETGQRVAGALHWLHSASTVELTWYGTHDKRGAAAMQAAGILPAFTGVAVHDGWASYRDYACTHALCNAHHLRELIWLEEITGQPWTRKMIDWLREAKRNTDAARISQRAIPRRRFAQLRRRYYRILREGERANPPCRQRIRRSGRIKQAPAVNLLARLRRYAADVLRFLTDSRVPFDNNQAERDIRMPKLKQKTSGCFRTIAGARDFAIIRSYLSTLRKQGRDVLQALTRMFQNQVPDPLRSP